MHMYLKVVIVSLLLVVVQHVAKFVYVMEYHLSVYNHEPGPCKFVQGVEAGSEDIESLPNGLAFITTGIKSRPRESYIKKSDVPKSKIMLFDFNKPFDVALQELTFEDSYDADNASFHGISLWQEPDLGEVTVVVVNHHPLGERIDSFRFNKHSNSLTLIRTLNLKLRHSIYNDVVATGPNTFYFTQFYYGTSWILNQLELLLLLPWGSVWYYNGEMKRKVADGLLLANGINMSPDNRYLYINYLFGLKIYQMQQDGAVIFKSDISVVGFHNDNVFVERDTGNLWIGGQSVFHESAEHLLKDAKLKCPSKVYRFSVSEGNVTDIKEVYANDGNYLKCASAACYHKSKLLIGTVFHKLLYCDVTAF